MSVRVERASFRTAPIVTIALFLTATYVVAVIWSMGRADYSAWMALLLAPVLVVVTLPALRRQSQREHDVGLYRLLAFALILKLCAAPARYFITFGFYGGLADSTVYHQHGIEIAENFRSLIFQTGLPDLHSTQFIRFFTGIVYTLVGPTRLGGFLIYSWLGFIGLFLLYRSFVIAVPRGRSRTYARFVFFFPSMLFWSSSIGKEAWMVFAIGVTCLGIARVCTNDIRRALLPLIGGLWMVAVVRPHVAAMLGIGGVVAYLVKPANRRLRELAPLAKGGALALMTVGALLLVQRTDAFLRESGVREEGLTGTLQQTTFRTQQGGSGFIPSALDSPARAPIAVATVLFRPLLFEAGNLQAALAALEGTALLLWCTWRWRWILAAVRSVRRQPYVGMAIAYIGLFVLAFSSIANFGMLARQRVQVLPFLFILLAIPPNEGGEKSERRPEVAREQVR